MNPKKPKHIYKKVAEDLNVSEQMLDDLGTFYYKELRQKLSNLEYPFINVTGLGVFRVLITRAKKSVQKLKQDLEKQNAFTYTGYFNKKNIEKKIEQLEKINVEIDKFIESKEKFKKEKYESTKDLEKQDSDS